MQLDIIPDWKKIVEPYKQGVISEKEYRERYFRQLDKAKNYILPAVKTFQNLARRYNKEIVFLCYEKTGNFCHRHLLAEWLEKETGEKVKELKKPSLS